MSKPIKGYSFSFTQPYGVQPKHPPLSEAQRIETANELAWMDYVESEFIQDMLTYPDAEAILNKITKENRND
jgi:hypothetical protein